jgi:hypothetical protein
MGKSALTYCIQGSEHDLIALKSVHMHQHLAHPPGPDPAPSLLDNISDTLLNAFSRVRKPDERFLEVRQGIDQFEEGLNNIDRLWGRSRSRSAGKRLNHLPYPLLILFLRFGS